MNPKQKMEHFRIPNIPSSHIHDHPFIAILPHFPARLIMDGYKKERIVEM
jgi:hypothetical protein